MELRHLRYFITVAEELNFVRAAEKLNIVQPALSKQIQALEKELGVKLFDRVKRKIQLTAAGQAFLEGAYHTLGVAEQAIVQAQRTHRGELGRLVVAYSSLVYFHLLPQILHLYKKRYPEVELVLNDLSTDRQLEGLIQGQLDIGFFVRVEGIIPSGKPYRNLQCESVLVEPIFVGLPRDHPLANRSEISLSELVDSPWLFFSP
jgi:DNA-binding transcriptional LysR family regulator